MNLTGNEIARMVDLSAVKAEDSEQTIENLVSNARKYHCHLVTTLPSQTPLAWQLLRDEPEIGVGGNIGFPSGGQTTGIKVAETRELIEMGCTELDMAINIGKLVSGCYDEVLQDIQGVVDAAEGTLLKVILECHYLSEDQIRKACDLSIGAGADFVKTGTGWAPSGATLENVRLIKSHVGDAIAIKASGGIRTLDTLLEMYRLGARRFGIGLGWAVKILDQAMAAPEGFEL